MTSRIARRLADLGHQLPTAAAPKYAYTATVQTGDLLYVSGQIPKLDGQVASTGLVGRDLSVEEGAEAAQLAALNLLAQVEQAVGLDRVARVVKLNGYVASAPGFYSQPSVIDGASSLLRDAFEDSRGEHARTALAAPQLPQNASVELEAIFELDRAETN
ncbi:RidA family protein [Leucobacter sp. GX24907]